MALSRRRIFHLAAAAGILSLPGIPASAQADIVGDTLAYRGFTVDLSAVRDYQDIGIIDVSVKHQIDIVADCGAKPEIIAFFQSLPIKLDPTISGDNGRFSANGVEIASNLETLEKPILLYELLHAYQVRMLPMGVENPDVMRFYTRARDKPIYLTNEIVLANPMEFFAVTASIYLWGYAAHVPYSRVNMKEKQRRYYDWLGQLFGVQK